MQRRANCFLGLLVVFLGTRKEKTCRLWVRYEDRQDDPAQLTSSSVTLFGRRVSVSRYKHLRNSPDSSYRCICPLESWPPVTLCAREIRSVLLFREIPPSITVSRLRSRIAFPTIQIRALPSGPSVAPGINPRVTVASGRACDGPVPACPPGAFHAPRDRGSLLSVNAGGASRCQSDGAPVRGPVLGCGFGCGFPRNAGSAPPFR
jgi:hypothetical protein